uniref:Ctr_SF1_1 conopeptide n=1 Tax=Conus tribblei TaxID=101761 RepID=A0A0K8TUF4_CONTD
MKSAVFMMVLSTSIFVVFTKDSATPLVPCSKPAEFCTTVGGTCGEYYRWGDRNYCFLFCECDVGTSCPTDEAHAIVRRNVTHPLTHYTCQPISEFPVCQVNDTAIVFLGPSLLKLVHCTCHGEYDDVGNGRVVCRD